MTASACEWARIPLSWAVAIHASNTHRHKQALDAVWLCILSSWLTEWRLRWRSNHPAAAIHILFYILCLLFAQFCCVFANYYELNIQQKHLQIDFRANFWCKFAFDLLFNSLNSNKWTLNTHIGLKFESEARPNGRPENMNSIATIIPKMVLRVRNEKIKYFIMYDWCVHSEPLTEPECEPIWDRGVDRLLSYCFIAGQS